MDRTEIAALAEGLVPFVRECVGDAVTKATILPSDLAEQIASAVRLLHESPPLEQRAAPQPSPPPRVTRIERDTDGNLVPVYSDDR